MHNYPQVIAMLLERQKNILLLSKAGGGKSSLLREYLSLRRVDPILVVAPTALAAYSVGGSTIHAAFELSPFAIPPNIAKPSEECMALLQGICELVIDEISMVRTDILNAVDARLREARGIDEAFGGVRVILAGDFYQLPPVVEDKDIVALSNETPDFQGPAFHSFYANAFRDENFVDNLVVFSLDYSFRHASDPHFAALLDRMRVGALDGKDIDILNGRHIPQSNRWPVLCVTKRDATETNFLHIRALGKSIPFEYVPKYTYAPGYQGIVEAQDDNVPLTLNDGCPVIFTRNLVAQGIFNGMRGQVSKIVAENGQIKEILVGREGHREVVITPSMILVRKPILTKTSGNIHQQIIGSIRTFPLLPAYAMTIHRAQGLTLDSIAINLNSGFFACGQAYVAFSRAKRLEDIDLIQRVKNEDFKVDMSVKKFMAKIDPIIIHISPTDDSAN